MRTYCFDLDGTLCTNTNGAYTEAVPIPERISMVNNLYNNGSEIVIFTARGSTTGMDWTELTRHQLEIWKVQYHRLLLGKPFADIYVDDKGMSDSDFFKQLCHELDKNEY